MGGGGGGGMARGRLRGGRQSGIRSLLVGATP